MRGPMSFLSQSSPATAENSPGHTPAPSVRAPSTSNPFSTPPYSRPASTIGVRSGYQYAPVPGTGYFRSRRVRKEDAVPLPAKKKTKKEALLWIMPLCGLLLGLGLTGLVIYLKLKTIQHHKYCPVLNDDFSSGTLDPKVWTKEVQVGGYGNGQFEQTTADDENVFVQNGQLYIKPTLQDAALITTNNLINLTADGSCTTTSNINLNCVTYTNTTNGTIVQPVKSARINTKLGASIKYGKVEVRAKIPKGDWLWPAIWMLPVEDTYGAWPQSGEIDIMESRGNNYTYSLGGNNFVSASLHWGPDLKHDAYKLTSNVRTALHNQFGDGFHTYGLEWSEKYIFAYVDNTLQQVMYWPFNKPLWQQGNFPLTDANDTAIVDPWSQTGRDSTPFDQEFYLIMNVAVGGQNGWFLDGADAKPWVDGSASAKLDFWKSRDQWYPTWEKDGQMIVDNVQMWQQC
ncbi:glycoside hydrolase family 16 protein [Rutstroemia sp. NJR-2017a BBW]|nr:glycoside hydrolase family 16 protein [Rutstroemia sp. NJR-2017a BBW]